jgi:hypothetical protein
MPSDRPRVIVGVSEHWLLGALPLADDRIQDRMNDSRSEFTELSNVEVHPCTNSQCVANLPEIVIPKSKILFLAADLRQHEAPAKRLDHFAKKNVFRVFANLSRYCISGELHLPTFTGNTVHTLSHQLPRFFPLTDASLSGSGVEGCCAPLLIVNKDYISSFHVEHDSQRDSGEEALEQLRALVGKSLGETALDGA